MAVYGENIVVFVTFAHKGGNFETTHKYTMELQTKIDLVKANFEIAPCARMLFVGSCFADNMGARFGADGFRVTVNPYGVMYNPVSIGHTIDKLVATLPSDDEVDVVVLTLGTNHIYILRSTGEVVDNCQKRPQKLFEERQMTIDQVTQSLDGTVSTIHQRWPGARVIITVSPIRYRKYGMHGSQLSKATLLLATAEIERRYAYVYYFPSYEIMNDELRDYRFYAEDMIHPSAQAVDYIHECMGRVFFGHAMNNYMAEWLPVKQALGHKPFNAESQEYKDFMDKTMARVDALSKKYPNFALFFKDREK